jgi:hypothetical protein
MYGVVSSLLGPSWADIVTPLVYALLFMTIVYSAAEPNAGFTYLTL